MTSPYAYGIYYKRSGDGGQTWGPDVRITSQEAKSFRHASAVSGSTIHEVWMDKRHNTISNAFSTDGNWEIYYTRSLDDGESWAKEVRLTDMGSMVCGRPAIGVVGRTILVAFVAWEECGRGTLDGAFGDIFTIGSKDGGETWDPAVAFTEIPYQSTHPQIVAAEPGIFGIVWEDGRSYDFGTETWQGPTRLLSRRSRDLDVTWEAEEQINEGEDGTHSLVYQKGSQVHLTWTDRIEGKKTACYAFSPDGGCTWDPPECLTTEGNWWAGPACATQDGVIVMMHPDGQTEAYSRVGVSGVSTASI